MNTTDGFLQQHMWSVIGTSVVFAVVGILILVLTFWIIEKLSPQNLWKEIVEKQNKALAIMAAGFMLAMAWIIAAAMHG
jgi:putative membrane protein